MYTVIHLSTVAIYTVNFYQQYYFNNQHVAILHLIVAMQISSKIIKSQFK